MTSRNNISFMRGFMHIKIEQFFIGSFVLSYTLCTDTYNGKNPILLRPKLTEVNKEYRSYSFGTKSLSFAGKLRNFVNFRVS